MSAQFFVLDIGRSFIKAVKVKKSGNRKILEAAASFQTPLGGPMSEAPVDLMKVSESVKACVAKSNITLQNCIVSLIESQVVTRLIQLPNLTDKELSAAVSWEAEQYIPLPIKDVNLQYKIISRPESTSEKMDVLLVAAPKRMISKYINIVKNAGLKIVAMETESMALARALTKVGEPPTIIVSMGAISTDLVIADNGNVLFTRSVATGGVNLTKAIMTEFNLPQNQAEQYKQTYGILEDKLSGKVADVLKPVLDVLIGEIQKAIEFSHMHTKDLPVSRLVICGGGAFLPGISQFLTQRTNLEVSLGDAWADFVKEGVILQMVGKGGIFSVATGLALNS